MTTQYLYSEFERQEFAINTIYDVLNEFTARESKRSLSFDAGLFARFLVLFVCSLALANLVLVLYLVYMW